MYVRTIIADVIPGKSAQAVSIFREEIMPVIREQPGYVSSAIYINHRTNQAQTVSFWESKEAMEATAQGTEYLARVVGMLRSCLVNREYAQWEVGAHDEV